MIAQRARRIDRGRSHSYTLDGRSVEGVTTIVGKALPKPALVNWAAREVAEYVAERRQILAELSDEELIDLCKYAPFRVRDKAANQGTAVHRFADVLAHGGEVGVPEHLVGHVDAYLAFLDTYQPSAAVIERPVFSPIHWYAGTFDMLCTIEGLGRRCLLDIKTNRSGPFGETALQLAAYGHADFYVDEAGVEVPMPAIDWYGVIWVRSDGFDLYPFEVGEEEWAQFLRCLRTALWIDNRMPSAMGNAIVRSGGGA